MSTQKDEHTSTEKIIYDIVKYLIEQSQYLNIKTNGRYFAIFENVKWVLDHEENGTCVARIFSTDVDGGNKKILSIGLHDEKSVIIYLHIFDQDDNIYGNQLNGSVASVIESSNGIIGGKDFSLSLLKSFMNAYITSWYTLMLENIRFEKGKDE